MEAGLKRRQTQVGQPMGSIDPQLLPNGPNFLSVAPWWLLGPILRVRAKLRWFASSGRSFDPRALF
jgi:hypothetical protein